MRLIKSVIMSTLCMMAMSRPNDVSNHIEYAHNHIKTLKDHIEELFNKKSTVTIKDLIQRIDILIDRIDILIKDAAQKYHKTQMEKYTAMLRVLKFLKKEAFEVRRVLEKKYYFFLTFAHALKKLFDKLNTASYRNAMMKRFKRLRSHLCIEEQKELDELIKTLGSIKDIVPNSKIKTFIVLRALYKR